MSQRASVFALCGFAAAYLATPSLAQCDWKQVGDGLDRPPISVMQIYDDGDGELLFIGGIFNTVDGIPVSNIAAWDGRAWLTPGDGLTGVEDDDPAEVYSMAVFDDGDGPALYVGGIFGMAGSEEVFNVAKWDGTTWEALGDGIIGEDADDPAYVYALAVYDDGGGPQLYAGGDFEMAGAAEATNIARWDGLAWSVVGEGTNNTVRALTVYDGDLYAGGDFTQAGGAASFIAKWDGSEWERLRGGTNGSVLALEVFDDGTGELLYVGGNFDRADGRDANNIARWDGRRWASLGEDDDNGTNGSVFSMAVFDSGQGDRLYVGGNFSEAGNLTGVGNIATWDGGSWDVADDEGGMSSAVMAMSEFKRKFYAGGFFQFAGTAEVFGIARLACRPSSIARLRKFDIVRGTHIFGGRQRVKISDDKNLKAISDERRRVYAKVRSTTNTSADDARELRLRFESTLDEPAGRATILLYNHINEKWKKVGEFTPGGIEGIANLRVDRARRFIDENGNIKMFIKYEVWVSQQGGRFEAFFDQVRTVVIE